MKILVEEETFRVDIGKSCGEHIINEYYQKGLLRTPHIDYRIEGEHLPSKPIHNMNNYDVKMQMSPNS